MSLEPGAVMEINAREVNEKYENLKSMLKEQGRILVAFSGGVDSTFLLYVSHQVLGDCVQAATFDSSIHARKDIKQAKNIAGALGIKHHVIKEDLLLNNNEFTDNPPNRCYICKKLMMEKLKDEAQYIGDFKLVDGANAGDLNDYRPGMIAAREMGIMSPLKDVGFTKDEIRLLAREEGLDNWNRPASPCLCSRIPYGDKITNEKLKQIEAGEELLNELGFEEVRLRHHNELARLEVPVWQMSEVLDEEILNKVKNKLKEIGFKYITLDLEGFRSGNLNELLW